MTAYIKDLFGGPDRPLTVDMVIVDAGEPGVLLKCLRCDNETEWIYAHSPEELDEKMRCEFCNAPGILEG